MRGQKACDPKGNTPKGNTLSDPTLHNISDSDYIAYSRFSGRGPGIIFLPGHGSDMEGGKALFLEAWAKAEGRAFLRFDYRGHGLSSGSMQTTGISDWTADVVTVIDELTTGPQILGKIGGRGNPDKPGNPVWARQCGIQHEPAAKR